MLVVACSDISIVSIDALCFFISQVMNVFIVRILKNAEKIKENLKLIICSIFQKYFNNILSHYRVFSPCIFTLNNRIMPTQIINFKNLCNYLLITKYIDTIAFSFTRHFILK